MLTLMGKKTTTYQTRIIIHMHTAIQLKHLHFLNSNAMNLSQCNETVFSYCGQTHHT